MSDHVPTCDVLVRNGECTCPKVDDRREADVLAVAEVLYGPRSDGRDLRDRLADLIAAARREGAEQGWDEGFHKAGRLLTGMDRDPWPPTPNPYRQEKPE